jgi:pantothenate kinase
MKTAVKKGKRLLVVTKAGFVDKWIGDLKADLNLRPGELIKIDGLKGLAEMLHIALAGRMGKMDKNDKEIKAMVISSHAIDDYIELFLTKDVVVHPTDILKTLGVGFLVYDESHMLFRKNYWSFIMLNIPELMDLSATLQPDDAFLKLRYVERFLKF